uniref:30S ribosomal protein S17 n=1 Tax=Nephromyces sp. ex Molgula occidentalis TaxID=2544991 RepID=A0A5C1H835_9APIC|nr:30S ribosomal protein S17 [Nephromyces sp. ex Molgula occidentalis]
MIKFYCGYIIKKPNNKTAVVKSPIFVKKQKILIIKYKRYLIHDERNETKLNDLISFKYISCKSKNKFYKLINIIKSF